MKNKILKIASVIMSILMLSAVLAGCKAKDNKDTSSVVSAISESDTKPINVAVLKGPTALGMLKVMSDNKDAVSANNYNFEVFTSPDLVGPELIKGTVDIAAVPTNVAATLYNKQKNISIIAVNTLGVLSIVTNGENISSVSDLKGKTIYATNKGTTTEYALNYVLEKNGLKVGEDVKVEYKAEHAELAALVASGSAKIAMLPEPFVTNVTLKNANVKVALDLSKEWKKVSEDGDLVMGCIVVRNEFLNNNKDAVDAFLNEYSFSTAYVNDNHEKAGALSEKFDILPAATVTKAIPKCNIVFRAGEEMKASVSAYLKTLLDANPKSIGNALPDEGFYYVKK